MTNNMTKQDTATQPKNMTMTMTCPSDIGSGDSSVYQPTAKITQEDYWLAPDLNLAALSGASIAIGETVWYRRMQV